MKTSITGELEDYDRKTYQRRFHASEEDNKKLQEKIKGLQAEAALE